MTARIGIHPDRFETPSFSDRWADALRARGAEAEEIDLLSSNPLEGLERFDGIMWRWAHNPQHKQSAKQILYTIEHYLRIPVFPPAKNSWHYDEKVLQHFLLDALKAPMPKVWLFWYQDQALRWADTASYPVIFKLSCGAGSSNVLKIDTRDEAQRLIGQMFNGGIYPYTLNEFARGGNQPNPPYWKPEFDYAYFQEFLPGNAYDTRIIVLGGRAFGVTRENRPGDFRASGSGLIGYDPKRIDLRMVELAFEISKKGGFTSMAYDFLYKAGEPVITEISYTFPDYFVHNSKGYWRPDLSWVEAQMWPQEAQVEDFLQIIRTGSR